MTKITTERRCLIETKKKVSIRGIYFSRTLATAKFKHLDELCSLKQAKDSIQK